jgi:hypothetical protein
MASKHSPEWSVPLSQIILSILPSTAVCTTTIERGKAKTKILQIWNRPEEISQTIPTSRVWRAVRVNSEPKSSQIFQGKSEIFEGRLLHGEERNW